MVIIDTHSHLYANDFKDDISTVIERARDIGITCIFIPNEDSSTIGPLLELCKKYEGYCFPMIGLHPSSVNSSYKSELNKLADVLKQEHAFVAIGEVGLDMHWDKSFLNEQKIVFEQQVCWALEYDMPVIIHCRDAFEEMMDVLKHYQDTPLKGIFHSYMGNPFEVVKMLNMEGFLLGINGIVTYNRSVLPDILKNIPLDRIVLETDSPYLPPVPFRGKRNESSYIIYTLNKVASVYNIKPEVIAEKTSSNAMKLFGMKG